MEGFADRMLGAIATQDFREFTRGNREVVERVAQDCMGGLVFLHDCRLLRKNPTQCDAISWYRRRLLVHRDERGSIQEKGQCFYVLNNEVVGAYQEQPGLEQVLIESSVV